MWSRLQSMALFDEISGAQKQNIEVQVRKNTCRCAWKARQRKKSGKRLAKYSVNTTFWAKIGCKICYKQHLGAPRFSCSKILGCAIDKLCSLACDQAWQTSQHNSACYRGPRSNPQLRYQMSPDSQETPWTWIQVAPHQSYHTMSNSYVMPRLHPRSITLIGALIYTI